MSVPTPQEIADLLRTVDFAVEHGMTSLVAFGDRRYERSLSRDFDRMQEARRKIKAMLESLPAAIPLTDEKMAQAGRVIGAVLDKRFGNGGDRAITDALDAMTEAR
jgi:hypothetical protein